MITFVKELMQFVHEIHINLITVWELTTRGIVVYCAVARDEVKDNYTYK